MGNKKTENNLSSNYKDLIISALDKIKYTKKEYKGDIGLLQATIFENLQQYIPTLDWAIEKQASEKYKDSVDILGYDKINDTYLVFELDTTRADQVAKKFTSRQALFSDKNILYISVCYPGTKNMSVKECAKYFQYCAQISELLNNKNTKKEFLGYFL